MSTIRSILFISLLVFVAVACQQVTPVGGPPAEAVRQEPEITSTLEEEEITVVEAELTPVGLPAPVQATLQAMTGAIQVPTRAPSADEPAIVGDDYVASVGEGCRIVRDHYLRDDFNGVDWDRVCRQYQARAKLINSELAFWELMEDLLLELGDNHSRFVKPEGFAAAATIPGEGKGVPWAGLTISSGREDDQLRIWDVCKTGPAAAAGLRRGDIVLAINGERPQPTKGGFDERQINRNLYDRAESVTLTVQRGPEQELESVTLHFGRATGCDGWTYGIVSENPRIGFVRVHDFGMTSDENILSAIERMERDQQLDGLILDVRHNPGGNADRDIAIFTSGAFGTFGPLRDDATKSVYLIRGPVRWNETTPVAVLIDGASQSAAEYFAAAMQQAGRAILVGMPTAGNTEAIASFNLTDGSFIRLAVSTLVLPDGSVLEGIGVTPDLLVPLGDWGLRQEPDVQFAAAYEAIAQQFGP